MPEKEKEVTILDDNGKEVKLVLKRPNAKALADAQKYSTVTWTNAITDGVLTRKELDDLLDKRGIWTKDKQTDYDKIGKDIINREQKLAKGGIKLSEAKEMALEIRILRGEMRELIGERTSMDSNTAEGLADNARFDYLVSVSVFDKSGNNFFEDIDDYKRKSSDLVAIKAAGEMANILYDLDPQIENNLPENKFLKQYKFVDEELRLVNKDGQRVDAEGRLINEEGRYIDGKGGYVDVDGNPIDEDGDYLVEDALPFLDDEGNPLAVEEPSEDEEGVEETAPKASKPKKKATRKKKAETTTKATVEAAAESE